MDAAAIGVTVVLAGLNIVVACIGFGIVYELFQIRTCLQEMNEARKSQAAQITQG